MPEFLGDFPLSNYILEFDRSGSNDTDRRFWRHDPLHGRANADWSEYAAGFPWLGVFCWDERDGSKGGGITILDPGKVRGVVLPYLPLWPGLIADLAFWSAAWWLTLWAVPTIRGARRRRRGLCAACGYDLSGSPDRCPECGRPR